MQLNDKQNNQKRIRRKRYKMALRSKDLVCKTMAAPGFKVYLTLDKHTHKHNFFYLFNF